MLMKQCLFKYINNRIYASIKHKSSITEDLTFKPTFSLEQQEKILSVLNESSIAELSRFDLTQSRIKNLDNWRGKNGRFHRLSDILDVEGLGEKILERLCNSIVSDGNILNINNVTNTKSSKNRKQILFPILSQDVSHRVSEAVGIHLAPTGVSWAKLSSNKNELITWSFHDFSSLPKKLLPSDTFDLAINIINQLPIGDIYVMEASPSVSPQNSKPVPTYTQQLELSSMLIALLNTNQKHNPHNQANSTGLCVKNKVFHLRSKITARMFRTLVGNERVSATETISTLLNNNNTFTLPCTRILVQDEMKNEYFDQISKNRDLLGQALLLVISFMDLCLYQNHASFAAIAPGRK